MTWHEEIGLLMESLTKLNLSARVELWTKDYPTKNANEGCIVRDVTVHLEGTEEQRAQDLRNVMALLDGVTFRKSPWLAGALVGEKGTWRISIFDAVVCTKVGTKKVLKKVTKILTPAVTEEVTEEVEEPITECVSVIARTSKEE